MKYHRLEQRQPNRGRKVMKKLITAAIMSPARRSFASKEVPT